MKRLTLTILILGILGFSLLAITGLSYAEDEAFRKTFTDQFLLVYREMLKSDQVAAHTFKAEVLVALETIVPSGNKIKQDIAKIGIGNNPDLRKEAYGIVERENFLEKEESSFAGRGSGNNGGGINNDNGGNSSGGTVGSQGNDPGKPVGSSVGRN